MNDQERAALLAAGEERLAFLEKCMIEYAQEKDVTLAKSYQLKYEGAAYMLEALGLISYWEYGVRQWYSSARYLAELYPESIPKEAAK